MIQANALVPPASKARLRAWSLCTRPQYSPPKAAVITGVHRR
eukprot:CAMPEP_0168416204 /NCGR_PEP_ID=MMETSP0228-20121227/30623_1 /TAXON_ID=133427 /ORGANISM="Protoceratium reticulatum, Strain CCCM 535 (=CCMP 1889)" /LENGTH=41 /DNA_ID= /DNA_START= /DNA_END= /DNA_ORIENTATION=